MAALDGKTALVTGASRGIGAAIARQLASDGAEVVMTYAGSAAKAEQVANDINAEGGAASVAHADVSSPDSVSRLLELVDRTLGGGLDILVNNAGVAEHSAIQQGELDEYDRIFRVNVRGTFDVTRHAVQRLRDQGRIITIGSCLALRAVFPTMGVYSASKAALAGFTRGWAQDLGPRGITVTCVQPGSIDTDLNPDTADNEYAQVLRDLPALKRYGKAEEIAQLVAFLASSGSSYLTGQTVTADGGLNA
ncbi:MAG: SDR family oxidoreductase [Planctomycetota bacterium]